jgi:hypothetical protein
MLVSTLLGYKDSLSEYDCKNKALKRLIDLIEFTLEEYYDDCERNYKNEYPGEEASLIIQSVLDRRESSHSIKLLFRDEYKIEHSVTLEAEHIDMETWEIINLYKEEANQVNEINGTYKFIFDFDTENLQYPCCVAGEIGSNELITHNMIDVNCDTYGSQLGYLAERIFVFYIPEIKKYSMVKLNYWST